jgi:hypothetical protein
MVAPITISLYLRKAIFANQQSNSRFKVATYSFDEHFVILQEHLFFFKHFSKLQELKSSNYVKDLQISGFSIITLKKLIVGPFPRNPDEATFVRNILKVFLKVMMLLQLLLTGGKERGVVQNVLM